MTRGSHVIARSRRARTLLAGFILTASSFGLAACQSSVSPSPTLQTSASPTPTGSAASSAPSVGVSGSPTASASPTPTPTSLASGPFTVLVLGGDNDFRTDAIMVVGVDPVHQTLSFASIPRDTINVPLPGGGTFRDQKINAFYDVALNDPARYPQGPARATADMVGTLLGIRIDYYAATSFQGFVNVVHAMGGVSVNLSSAVVDPRYALPNGSIGVRFPAGKQRLTPERALIFVRTRQGDSDFDRQRRQQQFLLAAGRQVVSHPELLPALLGAASNVSTDLPVGQIAELMSIFGNGPSSVQATVLGPRTYESAASCPCGYALQPNLDAMRRLAARFFPYAVSR